MTSFGGSAELTGRCGDGWVVDQRSSGRRCDMLLRDALGETLRDARTSQNRTLRDVSTAANVSLGYLSEVERGRKEASSELLAAICDALDLRLAEVLDTVSANLRTDAALAGSKAQVT